MKKIILNFESKSHNLKELIQEALNRNISDFLVSQDTYKKFENIKNINTYSRNPTIPTKYLVYSDREILEEILFNKEIIKENIGYFFELKSKEDEDDIKRLSRTGYIDFIMVLAKDWKIIPIENLIANMHKNDTDLIAVVETVNDAEIMLKTLEIGVDGILIKPENVNDIIKLKKLMRTKLNLDLTKAIVKNIQYIPDGERVCVDTTSILNLGEGFLVGSTAVGFCLIHSETIESQYISSRPFRVNAGDVSAYIIVPSNAPQNIYQTKYLSELKGGDTVLAVNTKGEARVVSVARVKIETRPLIRFEVEVLKVKKSIRISCICQNAETVRLVGGDNTPKSVVDIKVGDEIIVHIGPKALHFGTIIREKILEK